MNKGTKIVLLALGAVATLALIFEGVAKINPGDPVVEAVNNLFNIEQINEKSQDELNDPRVSAAREVLEMSQGEVYVISNPTPEVALGGLGLDSPAISSPNITYVNSRSKEEQVAAIKAASGMIDPNKESGNSVFVYGRYTKGEGAATSYSRIPEGAMLWSSRASIDGSNPEACESYDLLLSCSSPLSDEVVSQSGLIALGDHFVAPYLVMEEMGPTGKPVYYISEGLNGYGKPVGIITPSKDPSELGELPIFTMFDSSTGTYHAENAEVATWEVNNTANDLVGPATRETAMAVGYGCNPSSIKTSRGNSTDIAQMYLDMLKAATQEMKVR